MHKRKSMNTRTAHPLAMTCLGIVALTFFIGAPAFAQEAAIDLDPTQTQVAFTLGDVLHTVHGSFKLKSGTINFNPVTGHASGLIIVDGTSGDSGSHARDNKMNKDVLQSNQYPEISFAPERVEGQVSPQGDFLVQVHGMFNLHGGSHPLTLVFQVHITGDQVTASTNFAVPYASWGLKNPSTFILRVSDTVDIAIHAVGQIKFAAMH